MAWNPTANLKGPKGDKGDTGAPGGAADVQAAIQNFPAGTIESSDRVPFLDMSDAYKVKMGTLGSAALANILGTVSQSGGVPTGAIIQHGSNANGEFVRLADGTQICWYVLNHASAQYAPDGQTQLAFTWTFPATFVSAPPYVDLTPTGGGSGYFNLRVVAPSASNAGTLYMINTSNGYQDCGSALRCIAIGRWF